MSPLPRRAVTIFIGALSFLLFCSIAASRQPPRHFTGNSPAFWSLDYWLQPVETNAFRRNRGITVDTIFSAAFTDARMGWIVGDHGAIFATTDGGATWHSQKSGTNQMLLSVFFTNAATGWAVGFGGAVVATTDGGATWHSQKSGTTVDLYTVTFANETTGWAVGFGGAVIATTDGGATWHSRNSGTSVTLESVIFANAATGWAVGDGGATVATTDGGATWHSQKSGTSDTLESVFFANAATGWAVGFGGAIVATTDGGATWNPQKSKTTRKLNSVTFSSTLIGWAVGDGGVILATTDGGTTWHGQTSGTTDPLYSVSFSGAKTGWAVGLGGVILATADGGATWTDQQPYGIYPAPWFYVCLTATGMFLWIALRPPSRPDIVVDSTVKSEFVADRPLTKLDDDRLGFKAVALGLSQFLSNAETEPPLTVAIEGTWGSGKSSLMGMVCDRLKTQGFTPVWFNAWHHQQEDQLLAALLVNIREQAVPSAATVTGLNFRLRLLRIRAETRKVPILLALTVLAGFVGYFLGDPGPRIKTASDSLTKIAAAVKPEAKEKTKTADLDSGAEHKPDTADSNPSAGSAKKPPKPASASGEKKPASAAHGNSGGEKKVAPIVETKKTESPTAGTEAKPDDHSIKFASAVSAVESGAPAIGFLSGVLGLIVAAFSAMKAFGVKPANLLVTSAAGARIKDLEDKTSFRFRFAKEFGEVSEALKPRNMTIIVDDLDRCRSDQVLAILEAVNFLVSSGECFVLMGLDMDRVELCVGMELKDMADAEYAAHADPVVLPADATAAAAAKEAALAAARLRFAHKYLEKLINIEVSVPVAVSNEAVKVVIEEEQMRSDTMAPPSRRERLTRQARSATPAAVTLGMLGIAYFGTYFAARPPAPTPTPVSTPAPVPTVKFTPTLPPAPSGQPTGKAPPTPTPASEATTPTMPEEPARWPIPLGAFVIFAVVGGAILALRRADQKAVTEDPQDFRAALRLWLPLVNAASKTPRALKRFVNRTRFYAMLQKAEADIADAITKAEQERSYAGSATTREDLVAVETNPGPEAAVDGALAAEPRVDAGQSAAAALSKIPYDVTVALATIQYVSPEALSSTGKVIDYLRSHEPKSALLATLENCTYRDDLETHRAAFAEMSTGVKTN